jgi:ATP synthase F1 delta subunit
VELSQEKNALEAVHSDMDSLSAVFADSSDVADYLMSPVVSEDDKKKMIATLGSEAGFSELTTNFLSLLVDKQRMDVITEVMTSFEEKYCELTDTQVSQAAYSWQAPRGKTR